MRRARRSYIAVVVWGVFSGGFQRGVLLRVEMQWELLMPQLCTALCWMGQLQQPRSEWGCVGSSVPVLLHEGQKCRNDPSQLRWSSCVLLSATSANAAAMAPLGAERPRAAARASGDSLSGDQFTEVKFPCTATGRAHLTSEMKCANNLLPTQSYVTLHCCQAATLRDLLQLPHSSSEL